MPARNFLQNFVKKLKKTLKNSSNHSMQCFQTQGEVEDNSDDELNEF